MAIDLARNAIIAPGFHAVLHSIPDYAAR